MARSANYSSKVMHIQQDFSGGEVGLRVAMRNDSTFFAKSVIVMENYMPTLQGTAVRVPGTRFLFEADASVVRLIPYLTPTNEHVVVEVTPGQLRILGSIAQATDRSISNNGVPFALNAITPAIFQVAKNPYFELGVADWELYPLQYTSYPGDGSLGCWLGGTATGPNIVMLCRDWKDYAELGLEFDFANVFGTAVVPDTGDGIWLKIRVNLQYETNFSGNDAEYQCFMAVGTVKGGNDLWSLEFTGAPGAIREFVETVTPAIPLTPGQVIHTSVQIIAIKDPSKGPSSPMFRLYSFEVFAKGTIEISDEVVGVIPYTAEDLPQVQYIQSPYPDSDDVTSTGKELVMTHPKYPPQQLIVRNGVYIVEAKPFNDVPDEWSSNNYPAACTSFNGRLVLSGSQQNPIPGDPVGSAVETTWCTEVGKWNILISDPPTPENPGINANDSVTFTTIYRSPIQWVFGQKDLLIGAKEMEYIASADGVFQPADIGVFMHSTHGSAAVQPVGLGETVVFAAEGGTKVRSMNYRQDDDGWGAPDLTLLHPDLFAAGIVRMVRMRNPHQMVIVVMKNGQLGILHQDTYAGIQGWSRLNLNAPIKDACVISSPEGSDILVLTVNRIINGVSKLYIESITNWVEGRGWDYTQSSYLTVPDFPTNVITGVDHLNGQTVQVIADSNFIGSYTVVGGTITLKTEDGLPIIFTGARVGLQMQCTITTLPIVGDDPKADKRFSNITVRTLGSSRPIINGERPADRDPSRAQNYSQNPDLYRDNSISNMGIDPFALITITENVPIRSEIVGIFGTVKSNNVNR